jgi:hypothetical protein
VNQRAIAAREVEMFFAIANDLRRAIRNGNHYIAHLCRDEMEVLKLRTENTTLRDRCARVLGSQERCTS